MSGGKSSSSTSSETSTESTQQGVEGVVTGRILQGKTITVTEEFPEAVQEAFRDLIDLAGMGLNFASGAGEKAAEIVSQTKFAEQQPVLSSIEKFIPVIIAGIAVSGLVLLAKR